MAATLVLVFVLVVGVNHLFGQRTTDVGGGTKPGNHHASAIDPSRGVTLAQELKGRSNNVEDVVVKYRPAMTVLDAMQDAANTNAAWAFQYQGSGASAFLTKLGEQSNGGAAGLNWLYEVNGKRAIVSFGVLQLEPGDHVLWKFAPYE